MQVSENLHEIDSKFLHAVCMASLSSSLCSFTQNRTQYVALNNTCIYNFVGVLLKPYHFY